MISIRREDNVKVNKFSRPILWTCTFGTKNPFVTDFTLEPKIVHNRKWLLNRKCFIYVRCLFIQPNI
jgi:hypothetical protein